MKALIFISLLLLAGCQKRKPPEGLNKDQVTADIEQMLVDYHNDIRKHGLLAEFKYLDDSKDFYWVPPGYRIPLSYDSVKAILEANAAGLRYVDFRWDTLQVFPLSNYIGSYTGIVVGSLTDTAGVTSSVKIIESGMVIKRHDGWKLLSGQSTNLEN